MKYKQILILMLSGVLLSPNISIAEEITSWEALKTEAKSLPWMYLTDDGIPLSTSHIVRTSEQFLPAVLNSCSDDDIEALYKVAHSAVLLKDEPERLDIATAIAGCKAGITALQCDTKRVARQQPLSTSYPLFRTCNSYNLQPDANNRSDYETLVALEKEIETELKKRCDVSIENQLNIFKNCAGQRRIIDLIQNPVVQEEINNLPAITKGVVEDGGSELSRYDVASYIFSTPEANETEEETLLRIRYAYELYNTFPANMEVCPDSELDRGAIGCFGKTRIYSGVQSIIDRSIVPNFDVSKLHKSELLQLRMHEAGMIDAPDQPASVKFAKYPPPLVPNWSEYFEKDRYTAETGIVLSDVPDEKVVEDQYTQVKTEPKPVTKAPAPMSAPVFEPERKSPLPGLVFFGGIIGLLLYAWYAIRRRRK